MQKSLFECVVRDQDWVGLKARLIKEFDSKEDSLRFYFLVEAAKKKTEHHGVAKPFDVEGTLIV